MLLEIDTDCTIVCEFTDVLTGSKVRMAALLPERRPRVFCMKNLAPERKYRVNFLGINADRKKCVGYVMTLPYSLQNREGHETHEEEDEDAFGRFTIDRRKLRVVTISDNLPTSMESGDENPWQILHTVLCKCPWGGPDLILHLGGQVDIWHAFEKAIVILRASGRRSVLENRAMEVLRDAYRFAWNAPYVKEVLAHCPNMMMWGEVDILGAFCV